MVPELPDDVVVSVVSQLAAAAIDSAAHDKRSDTFRASIQTLMRSRYLNKIFHRAATTKLESTNSFWADLCAARWSHAVPPTNDLRRHFVKR